MSILAAEVPTKPKTPTTTVNGENVEVSWDSVYDGGSPLTRYTISILQSDGTTYSEDLTNCDGSDSTIMSSR